MILISKLLFAGICMYRYLTVLARRKIPAHTYVSCEAGIPSDMSNPARSALSLRSRRDYEWKEGIPQVQVFTVGGREV